MKNYKEHWDCLLNQRDDLYYKYTRCGYLLDLYGECLQEEPPCIPRKFRKDKYHVTSQKEKNINININIATSLTSSEKGT